jgi:protoporphyrinogen oxidase
MLLSLCSTMRYMRIAVVGGGFTGLAAAYELSKQHDVVLFEKESLFGGLANGWKEKAWKWSLEKSYHHLFTNDSAIISLIHELGLSDKLIIKRPITANYIPVSLLSSSGLTRGSVFSSKTNTDSRFRGNDNNTIAQLDSPLHLLRFPGLSMIDKFRTGGLAAFCKIYPFWQTLEGITAKQLFTHIGGKTAWEIIWEPLMTGKFGHYDNTIAASWLWARVHKRTSRLCYIEGGFQTLVDALADAIRKNGGIMYTNTTISSIKKGVGDSYIIYWKKRKQPFDKILLTIPTPLAYNLLSLQPTTYNLQPPLSIPHLHAQTLILETKTPILNDVYWLSITDRSFPFLAIVAHTNFMNKKQYGGHHLTYIGNYLPEGHPYLSMTKQQLFKKFLPFIKRLNPSLNSKLKTLNSFLFTSPFAQPVHQLHYSRRAPKLVTPAKNIYLANIDSIYPWDRGTNYAVELGLRAARVMSS